MSIRTDQTSLEVGEYVELFVLDAVSVTGDVGDVYYFTQATLETDTVNSRCHSHFLNQSLVSKEYVPVDIEANGFETTGQGTLPRPTLTISNVTNIIAGAVIAFGDLLGAKVYRYRTLRKYLDGETEADPGAYWPPDLYVLQQKTEHNNLYITWTMASLMDFQGQKLPKRVCLRDNCTHIYRYWNGSAFDYTWATCPYTNEGTSSSIEITGIQVADAPKAIEGITQDNPAVVTITDHGFYSNDTVYIDNQVQGMLEILQRTCTITRVDKDNFSLDDVNSTSYRAWTSGGNVYRNPGCTVSVGYHEFSTGAAVYIDSDCSIKQLQNKAFTITVISNTEFVLNNVLSVGYATYTGGGTVSLTPSYYDIHNASTTADKDFCNHLLSGCEVRFPGGQALPTTAFPAIGKTRAQ